MDHSLKPNTSVLKRFSSDKPRQHAGALYSHTESSGGGVCVCRVQVWVVCWVERGVQLVGVTVAQCAE